MSHVTSTIDPSMLDLFRAELEVHLPALNEGLLALEKDPRQPKRLEALMRAAHSIKGAAKIVGVEPAVRVAHAFEDCFVAAQKGEITLSSDGVDVLLRGVDALHRVTVPGDDGLGEAALGELLEAVALIRAGRAVARAPVESGPPTLRPAGDLDAVEAEALRGRLAELWQRGVTAIRLDLVAVRDVDPTGLAFLAAAARRSTTFEIVNVSPAVESLLRLTRLDRVFRVGGGARA